MMSHMDGSSSFIHMHSGVEFYFMSPDPDSIRLDDIARNLANTSRYNGGTRHFYSTAQHSIIMSYIAEDDYDQNMARAALLHDAGEAYVGEIVKPLKVQLSLFEDREAVVTRLIFKKYGLNPDLWNCIQIKHLDNLMVSLEYRDLRKNCPPLNFFPPAPDDIEIGRMGPEAAHRAFIRRFVELFPEHSEEAGEALIALE